MNSKFDFSRWIFKLDPNDVSMALNSGQDIACYFIHNMAVINYGLDEDEIKDVEKAGGIILTHEQFISTSFLEGIDIEREVYGNTGFYDGEPEDDYYHPSINY